MIKIAWVISFSILFSIQVQAKNCVDGVWFFDVDDSDNLKKLKKELFKRSGEKSTVGQIKLPAFVLSSEDLIIQRLTDSVRIQIKDEDGKLHERYFSTVGKTKAVSLKNINSGVNTVVASWEEQALIVETTTPQGVYIEETFTLEQHKTKSQRLLINSRIQNRTGLKLAFEKVYLQQSSDWQQCLNLPKT